MTKLSEVEAINAESFLAEDLKDFIKKDNWEIVGFLIREPEPMTKVLVMDNAEEERKRYGYSWCDKKEKMVGQVLEVQKDFEDYCNVYNKDKSNYQTFPKTCLCPIVEEAKEEDDKTEEAINLLREKGYKIIKK
jgi:hypothetical protein